MPAVREVGSYLATHDVKKCANKGVAKWSTSDDFVPSRVCFRLPEEEIRSVLRLLTTERVGGDTEIELASDGERTGDINSFVVTIEKLAQFTREQLEAMQWLWNLQSACREAVLCCTWLTNSVKKAENDTAHPHVALLQLLECWPYASIKGFGFDLTYADLFCQRDSEWLNGNAMRAVAVSLARYKNNQSVMPPPPTNDEKESALHEKTIGLVAQAVSSRPFVLIPVNLGGVHWAGIVVDRTEKKVKIYDSLNGTKNRKALHKLVGDIIVKSLKDDTYEQVDVTEPKQKDSNNYGVFVSLFF
ncbi:hypothetical protein DVH05_006177 [Phytophthora capsici]|nr:hypothetical protein DVH05_006177 [Phytophthora capsici]